MRRVARQPRTQQRLLTWHGVILVICASIVLSTWALASPPGSSPDDEFHLASIWCATGYSTGICEQTNDPEVIAIPKLIALDGQDKPCFVFRIETSGTCLFVGDVNALTPHPAARANSGLYPPIYYTVMRAFVTPKTLASATIMRLFNIALAVALLFATLVIARPATRRALAAASIVSLVPLGLFVIGSVNPSSWAVTGCLIAWAALLGFGENTTPTRRWLAGGLYLIGAGMAMAARADSVAYIGVITIAAILVSPELRAWGWRHRIIVSAIIGASILIVAGFLLRVDQANGCELDVDDAPVGPLVEDGGADTFGLVETVDRFHQGVVVCVADGPDRGQDAFDHKMIGQANRRILRAGIRVMDQFAVDFWVSFSPAFPQRHP